MLYDTRWDKTKTDPLSLESLIAWLETMPADKTYCYNDSGNCLFHQYLTAMGEQNISVAGTHWYDGREIFHLPENFILIPVRAPHTFGAALERAKAAL